MGQSFLFMLVFIYVLFKSIIGAYLTSHAFTRGREYPRLSETEPKLFSKLHAMRSVGYIALNPSFAK